MKMAANSWTQRLITSLFTAAAAWGSVTVEIRRVVDARAEITEQRLGQRIADQMDAALRYVDRHSQAQVDSLTRSLSVIAARSATGEKVQLVQVREIMPDTVTRAALDETNERLRNVAIAILQLRNEITELQDHNLVPKDERGSKRKWPGP